MPLVGLSLDASADFRQDPRAKNAGLFAALDRRYGVEAVLRPELPPIVDALHRARAFDPVRGAWRSKYNLDPGTFRARSRVAGRLLDRHAPDALVVQLHTLVSPGVDPEARRFVLHTDNTYRLSQRGWPRWAPLHGRLGRERLAQEGSVFRAAAYLFPRSEWLRRSMIEDYGCDPSKVVVVGGGANLVAAALPATRRWDGRAALFVGLDFERKGGHVLLEAWRDVRRALPDARLSIATSDPPPGRLPEGVSWLGHIRDRSVLEALYRDSSVFVMPSLFEPWGHVFYEAMGNGLPCVAARACAMPEIVRDGVDGRLVPPGDVPALADAMVALLDDPSLAERMGRAAHAHTVGGRGWDDVVARMAPHLERLGVQPTAGTDALIRSGRP